MSTTETMMLCAKCGFYTEEPVERGGLLYHPDCAPRGEGGYRLRPYQEEAVEAVFGELGTRGSTLLCQPTGSGKTIIFADVIRRWGAGRIMVMAHRDELIRQACDKIARMTGEEPDVEMAAQVADQRGFLTRAKVVVTSVQTMSRPRRHSRFHPEDFSLLIVDEAHHAVAPSYQAVMQWFQQNPNLKVLGVTATPDRSDELALGRVFETVAFDYSIVQAIDDGWLVPICQEFVPVHGLDFSVMRTTAGDLNQGDLAKVVEAEEMLHKFAVPTMEIADGRQTLVFCATVDQAERLSEIFNRHDRNSSEWICGDEVRCPRESRREILRRYARKGFRYLVNCAVVLEGFDEPGIEVIAVARPTKSRSLYAQIVGRGTRPLAGAVDGLETPEERRAAIARSGKPFLTVLDFVGNAGRHKLMHTGDILGGDYDTEIIAAAATEVASKRSRGERADMLATLREMSKQREEQARKRRMAVVATAKYSRQKIDPFDIFAIAPVRERGWDKDQGPTESQCARLEKFGIDARGLSRGQARQLVNEAVMRIRRKQCTFKQAKLLVRHGFDPNVTFEEASATIDRIAKSGWKLRGSYQGD